VTVFERKACASMAMRQTPMAVALFIGRVRDHECLRGWWDLHSTHAQNNTDGKFSPDRHLQSPGDDDWDRQDHQICEEFIAAVDT
jgi:hypothetical protein